VSERGGEGEGGEKTEKRQGRKKLAKNLITFF
jgi:hypothetical protein